MTRIAMLLTLLLVVAACGRRNAPDNSADEALAAAATASQLPKVPMITYFDLGKVIDSLQNIVGGTLHSFVPGDSIWVSIRTQYVPAGSHVSVRIVQGKKTLDSVEVAVGTPDATELARMARYFEKSPKLPKGKYQVEVLFEGKSQGLKDFEIQS